MRDQSEAGPFVFGVMMGMMIAGLIALFFSHVYLNRFATGEIKPYVELLTKNASGAWSVTVDEEYSNWGAPEQKLTVWLGDLGLFHPKNTCELARIIGAREGCDKK